MKKIAATALMLGLLFGGTVYAITEKQATVMPALETLKLELVKSKVIGGPQKYKVTKKTLDLLKKAMDDGDVIILDGDGMIKIEKDKDAGDK